MDSFYAFMRDRMSQCVLTPVWFPQRTRIGHSCGKKVEKFLRTALLVLSLMAVGGPAAGGVLMMLISMMFCDSGPFQRCVHMGLMFLAGMGFCALLPSPIVVALLRNKKEPGWYMHVYPLVMLGLACVAYAGGAVALGMTKIVFGYAALALVAFAYLLLHHAKSRNKIK